MPHAIEWSFATPKISAFFPSSSPIAASLPRQPGCRGTRWQRGRTVPDSLAPVATRAYARPVKERILRLALVGAIALTIPAAAALAKGPGHGQTVSAEKRHQDQATSEPAEDEDTGKPETAGDRPHNHGWYVSQAAKNQSLAASNAEGKSNHGAAVSAVAQSDQGKP